MILDTPISEYSGEITRFIEKSQSWGKRWEHIIIAPFSTKNPPTKTTTKAKTQTTENKR